MFTTEAHAPSDLAGICVADGADIYVACPGLGCILRLTAPQAGRSKSLVPAVKLPGSAPLDLTSVGDAGLLIADVSQCALLRLPPGSNHPTIWLEEHAQHPLIGPSAIVATPTHVLFIDSGGRLATSLTQPTASLYAVNRTSGVVQAVAVGGLADPRQLTIAPDGAIFLAEFGASRILQVVQTGQSLFVVPFATIDGDGAPCAVAATATQVFVGVDEFNGNAHLRVINRSTGQLQSVVPLPAPPSAFAVVAELGVLFASVQAALLSVPLVKLENKQ